MRAWLDVVAPAYILLLYIWSTMHNTQIAIQVFMLRFNCTIDSAYLQQHDACDLHMCTVMMAHRS